MAASGGTDRIGEVTTASFAALECRVGLGRLSVASDMIDVLGEYRVGALLPLTGRMGYAIGVWEGEALLSLSLSRGPGTAGRTTSGLILAVPGAETRWAFEIAAPVGLIEVTALSRPQSAATRWLRTATLSRGGSLQFVDLRALIGGLTAAPAERAP